MSNFSTANVRANNMKDVTAEPKWINFANTRVLSSGFVSASGFGGVSVFGGGTVFVFGGVTFFGGGVTFFGGGVTFFGGVSPKTSCSAAMNSGSIYWSSLAD